MEMIEEAAQLRRCVLDAHIAFMILCDTVCQTVLVAVCIRSA